MAYRPTRGGVAVAVPKAIDLALACPRMPPVVLPSGDGFVYLTGHELRFWTQSPDPDRRLVLFDVKDDDQDFAVSLPVWSPDGTKLALVSKASSYPAKTRLFVLTISAAGAVTAKTKHDVAVFSPCGFGVRAAAADVEGRRDRRGHDRRWRRAGRAPRVQAVAVRARPRAPDSGLDRRPATDRRIGGGTQWVTTPVFHRGLAPARLPTG